MLSQSWKIYRDLLRNITLPENRPNSPKRKRSFFNHPFAGAKMLVSGSVILMIFVVVTGLLGEHPKV